MKFGRKIKLKVDGNQVKICIQFADIDKHEFLLCFLHELPINFIKKDHT